MTLLSLTRELLCCPSICTCNITHIDCSNLDPLLSFNVISSQLPTNVTNLNLSRNGITLIDPGAFANLGNLLQLDLSRNQLLTLHPSTFYPLSSLEFLNLSSNFLEILPVDLFSELSNLRELILRDNRLKQVNSKPFQSLSELQRLDLSLNSLASMSLDLLDGLQGLEWLSLAGNKLRTIPRSALESLTVLQHLLLEGNRWNCSCSLVPLRHWVEWMVYRGARTVLIDTNYQLSEHDFTYHAESADFQLSLTSNTGTNNGSVLHFYSLSLCRWPCGLHRVLSSCNPPRPRPPHHPDGHV